MEIKYIVGKILQFLQIPQIHNCKIDKTCKIRFRCLVVNSEISKYSYIAENTTILDCKIGAFSSIASNCFIGGASHPTNWVSTSPVFQDCSSVLKKKYAKIKYNPYEKTHIGNDVWIGSNTLIKAGVTIGNGAVVGMGSVVTKNIGPYEIWAGNPAHIIRKRFDAETIKALQSIEWWDFSDEELKIYGKYFDNPQKFMEVIMK